jgi:hypothetical protein
MLAKQLKNALDGLDPTQLESMGVHVKLGEDERIEIVEDELVITLEFIDTGMGDNPPTFGPME